MSRYDDELRKARKVDAQRAERAHQIAQHPDVPDAPNARWWALALASWLAGLRPLYPCPPSATVTLEVIHATERVVRRYQPNRRILGYVAPPREPGPLEAAADAPLEVVDWLTSGLEDEAC